jgi:iron complex outermembrane recepter protein
MKLSEMGARPWAVGILLAVGAGMAQAQETGDELDTVPVDQISSQPEENLAVEEGAVKLDSVQVTGSRIRRTDFESAQPVLVISRDDIQRTGLTSIGDLLQDLPQAGPALNTLFNNGGNGSTEVDLRSLGSDRTLVLVNGKRWVGGVSPLSTGATDLNTIPISIIERIEILKDGASAIYGSDAIAGVINVITRRNVTGSDISSEMQITNKGDGLTQAHSFSTGTVSGATSMFFSVGYVNQREIRAGDRAISAVPQFGTGTTRGSPGTDHGFFLFVPNGANEAIHGTGPNDGCGIVIPVADPSEPTEVEDGVEIPGLPTGGIVPPAGIRLCALTRDPAQIGQPTTNSPDTFVRYSQNVHSYNFAPDNYLLTPQERVNIFGQLNRQFDNNMALNLELLYNIRRSEQELAAFPLQGGALLGGVFAEGGIHSTNPFNPFGQNIGQGAEPETELIGLGAYFRRINEQGPRVFQQNVDTFRLGSVLEGSFDRGGRLFNWDVGYHFTESTNRNVEEGIQNYDRVIKATGPVDNCVGSPDGCVPLNVFDGPGTITQEMIDYFAYTGISSQRNRLMGYSAGISTELMDLPYGPLGLALGAEYRKSDFAANPDPLVAAGRSTTNTQTPTIGAIAVREAYAEFAVPLLKNWVGLNGWLPVQDLELSLAGRYSKYDTFSPETTGKLGIRYKPLDDLLLRTTYSTAFRAPAVTDLFLGTITSFPSITDPCSGYTSEARNEEAGIENVRANCAADGVPESYTQSSSQIQTQFGGNTKLEPETATSLTAGFIYNPNWLPDFSIDVDFYRIRIEEVITFVSPGQVLDLCYRSDPAQRSLCERKQRAEGTGVLERLEATPGNLNKLEVSGVDIGISYLLPVRGVLDRFNLMPDRELGSFKLQLNGAYTDQRDSSSPTADGSDLTIGLVGIGTGGGAIPRWKGQSRLIWTLDNFDVTWNMRYIHHVNEICEDGLAAALNTLNLFAPPNDPVRTFEEQGLCNGRTNFAGIPGAENVLFRKIGSVTYHDLQLGYQLDNGLGRLVFGARNVLGKAPPVSVSAFANSFDPTLHELEDIVPYVRYFAEF